MVIVIHVLHSVGEFGSSDLWSFVVSSFLIVLLGVTLKGIWSASRSLESIIFLISSWEIVLYTACHLSFYCISSSLTVYVIPGAMWCTQLHHE